MTREEAKEILSYIRMAFLPEGMIDVARPCSITDQQVDEALAIAIESLNNNVVDMTYDPLERSVL